MLRKGHNIPELVFQFFLVNQMQSKFCFSRENQGIPHRLVTFWIQPQDFLVTLAASFSEPFADLTAAERVGPSLITTWVSVSCWVLSDDSL